MAKRGATVQLTADSVQDDTHEEAGEFEVASEEQMKQRLIKKAKRGRTTQLTPTGIFAGVKLAMSQAPNGTPPPPPPPPNAEYLSQLRSLNVSVSEWINKHVKENPHVDLTPIFRDYEDHLKSIDGRFHSQDPPSQTFHSQDPPSQTFHSQDPPSQTETEATSGTDVRTASESSGEEEGGTENATDTPQPSDCDEDSLFSVRAKLFYKKGGEFAELGLGTLRVQQGSPSGFILLMRNDTKLGNILLNVRVTEDIPVSSRGNNVFVVCVPNPALSGKAEGQTSPVTYLIRVKTAQLAEQLLRTVHKK